MAFLASLGCQSVLVETNDVDHRAFNGLAEEKSSKIRNCLHTSH